jgi:hypothetical protein
MRRKKMRFVCSVSQRMKFIFLLWITIRGTFDASVWATAVWFILGYFSNVLWLQCFGISIAIHLILNWPFVDYTRVHTKGDCLIYMRCESLLVGFAIMVAPILSILPTIAAISGDITFKPVTSLDPSGNSLVTHLAFCRLCSLQPCKK